MDWEKVIYFLTNLLYPHKWGLGRMKWCMQTLSLSLWGREVVPDKPSQENVFNNS